MTVAPEHTGGNPFRAFIHSTPMIDALVREKGMTRIIRWNAGLLQVFVYERPTTDSNGATQNTVS